MVKHQGKIVEHIVRRSGYNISTLAKDLKVNRRSLYNWFGNNYLNKAIIIQIGNILRHDFSAELPDVLCKEDFQNLNNVQLKPFSDRVSEEGKWRDKYIDLLEKFNELLN